MSPREHRIGTLTVQAMNTDNRILRAQYNARISLYEVMTDAEYDEFIRRLNERADNRATD